MKCPKCGNPKSGVYETRKEDGGATVIRKRQCQSKDCGHKWTTSERRAARAWTHI